MRLGKLALAALLVAAASSAQAQIFFLATDSGVVAGGAHPISDAKAAQFDAAAAILGTERFVTFESAPLGSFTNLAIASGVTLNGVDASGNPLTINNTPNYPTNTALDGFNTTVGGTKYVELIGGTATFTFSTPIRAFGAYFSGVQPTFFTDTITFNDGTSQSITIPAADATSGGVSFAGFTDAGKTISSLTITSGANGSGDFIGIDDVRFVTVTPAAVPEPGSVALLVGIGTMGAGFLARRRQHATKAA